MKTSSSEPKLVSPELHKGLFLVSPRIAIPRIAIPRIIVFSLVFGACAATEVLSQEPEDGSKSESVATPLPKGLRSAGDERSPQYWAEQLGHDRFLRRESATRELIKLGSEAVDPLLEVIAVGNLEINQRAVVVLAAIAAKQHHADEDGALGALNRLAETSMGSRKSMVDRSLSELAEARLKQALRELDGDGYDIGSFHYTFNMASTITQIPMLRIGDDWQGDPNKVSWARWLSTISTVELRGRAICKEVLTEVAKMPNLHRLSLVDGEIDAEALAALNTARSLNQLELRYVPLNDRMLDAMADVPVRLELSLMGTGVTEKRAMEFQTRVPGVLVHQHNGAFLGVKCDPGGGTCLINEIVPESAAMDAGLRRNDIIIGLDDVDIRVFNDLREVIKSHVAEDKIKVKYIRGAQIYETTAVLHKYQAP